MTETSTALLAPVAQEAHRDATTSANTVELLVTAMEAQHQALTVLVERVGSLCESFARSGNVVQYMNSDEAAKYLGKSVSWLLRQKRIPYYPGKPNRYKREDLDRWMDVNIRHEPML